MIPSLATSCPQGCAASCGWSSPTGTASWLSPSTRSSSPVVIWPSSVSSHAVANACELWEISAGGEGRLCAVHRAPWQLKLAPSVRVRLSGLA